MTENNSSLPQQEDGAEPESLDTEPAETPTILAAQMEAIISQLDQLLLGDNVGCIRLSERKVNVVSDDDDSDPEETHDILTVMNYSWWPDEEEMPEDTQLSAFLGTVTFSHGTDEIIDYDWEEYPGFTPDVFTSALSETVAKYVLDRLKDRLESDGGRTKIATWLKTVKTPLADIADTRVRAFLEDNVLAFGEANFSYREEELKKAVISLLPRCRTDYEEGPDSLAGFITAYEYDGTDSGEDVRVGEHLIATIDNLQSRYSRSAAESQPNGASTVDTQASEKEKSITYSVSNSEWLLSLTYLRRSERLQSWRFNARYVIEDLEEEF